MSSEVEPTRARRAAAITLALVLLVTTLGMLGGLAHGPAAEAAASGDGGAGISARYVFEGGDPFADLSRLEEAADAGRGEAPDWFVEEVGLPTGSRSVRFDPAGEVVGCVVDGRAGDVMAALTRRMTGAGWTAAPLGGVDGATFVKEDGECRWVLVSCTQVGRVTSVVFRCGR